VTQTVGRAVGKRSGPEEREAAIMPESSADAPTEDTVVDIRALLGSKREEILRIACAHGARNVRVFGSAARGHADETSDVDFLVEFEPGTSLLQHGAMIAELEELLGCKVDVAPEKTLRERVRERVLREAVPL
jgi:hypothetical protein